jgi:RNA polymerase sigma-70 factor (ECF subfamily)
MGSMDQAADVARTAPLESSEVPELASSFQRFVEEESARFHGALRLLTRDRSEAEDLMQDAFLKVWERWEHVHAIEDPAGYLYRTAMNLHRKRLRRAGVAVRHAVRPRPPRDHLDDVESRDVVLRTLATLTPRQRMSLVLTDLLDYSSEDAGRLMGVKATTVRVLASQGRAALRDSVGGEVDA